MNHHDKKRNRIGYGFMWLLLSMMVIPTLSLATTISTFSYWDFASTFKVVGTGPGGYLREYEQILTFAPFDTSLGTLSRVSLSWHSNFKNAAGLLITDPSTGLFEDDVVQGYGFSWQGLYLFGFDLKGGGNTDDHIRQSTIEVNHLNQPCAGGQVHGECWQWSPYYDYGIDEGQNIRDNVEQYYSGESDPHGFNGGPLLTEYKAAMSHVFGIHDCLDDEDICEVSATANWSGWAALTYEYDPPEPVEVEQVSVTEPLTLTLLALGLFGLGFNRRKRLN